MNQGGSVLRCVIAASTAVLVATAAAAEPVLLEVAQANVGINRYTHDPVVELRVSPASSQKLAEFTSANVGHAVEVRINGETVWHGILREPLLQGTGELSALTQQVADDLAARLLSGSSLEIEAVAP